MDAPMTILILVAHKSCDTRSLEFIDGFQLLNSQIFLHRNRDCGYGRFQNRRAPFTRFCITNHSVGIPPLKLTGFCGRVIHQVHIPSARATPTLLPLSIMHQWIHLMQWSHVVMIFQVNMNSRRGVHTGNFGVRKPRWMRSFNARIMNIYTSLSKRAIQRSIFIWENIRASTSKI